MDFSVPESDLQNSGALGCGFINQIIELSWVLKKEQVENKPA